MTRQAPPEATRSVQGREERCRAATAATPGRFAAMSHQKRPGAGGADLFRGLPWLHFRLGVLFACCAQHARMMCASCLVLRAWCVQVA